MQKCSSQPTLFVLVRRVFMHLIVVILFALCFDTDKISRVSLSDLLSILTQNAPAQNQRA